MREAVEAVLREVPAGPIESAIRAVLSESRLAGAEVGAWLRRQAARVGPDTEPAGSDDEPPALSEIAARLRHAVEGVEEDHFAELRLRLTERLAPR
ncbi:MAG: hypothetical protein HY744_15110 [Deltaproteobacteria bacterium]|nr:hypothetical protein [Deltaproteobacteria bacterium]